MAADSCGCASAAAWPWAFKFMFCDVDNADAAKKFRDHDASEVEFAPVEATVVTVFV